MGWGGLVGSVARIGGAGFTDGVGPGLSLGVAASGAGGDRSAARIRIATRTTTIAAMAAATQIIRASPSRDEPRQWWAGWSNWRVFERCSAARQLRSMLRHFLLFCPALIVTGRGAERESMLRSITQRPCSGRGAKSASDCRIRTRWCPPPPRTQRKTAWHAPCSWVAYPITEGAVMNRVAPIRPLSIISFVGVALVAVAACAGQSSPDDRVAQEGIAIEDPADREGHPPPAPRPCQSNDECSNACPGASKGCACLPGPHEAKVCIPTCESDADCPTPPDGKSLRCNEGACRPSGPPPAPPPSPCQADADCAGACPEGSAGCACHSTPHGQKICAPTCGTDADCPSGDGFPPLSCRDNFCVPDGPPRR